MRIPLKSLIISGLLALATPSFAQIHLSINFGPPPPRREIRVRAPFAGAIWVAGFYLYNDGARKYEWQPGRWEAPPAPNQVWVRPRYIRRSGHYDFYQGHWQDNGKHNGRAMQQGHPMNRGQAKKQGRGNRGGKH